MQLTSALTRNSILLFVGFSILVLWGFWGTYFSNPFAMPTTGANRFAVHLHGVSMTLWCLMLVLQAYLIRTKRRALHRMIGRSSYVLAPTIIFLQLLVVHNSAGLNPRNADSTGQLSDPGAIFMGLALGETALFAVLYGLAIYFRSDAARHMRYMVCTIFSAMPAATDRIIVFNFPGLLEYLPQIPRIEASIAFLLSGSTLFGLSVWDWRSNRRYGVFPAIFVVVVIWAGFTFNAHLVPGWKGFCSWFLGI